MYERRGRILRFVCHRLLIVLLFAASSQLRATQTPVLDFSTGWGAYEKGDYAKAVEIWSPLAEQGHENAQTNLGVMYDYGIGVPQDSDKAAKLYRAAAGQKNAAAQYNLAILISEGTTDAVDGLTAEYWLRQSAARGFEDAKRLLRQIEADPVDLDAESEIVLADAEREPTVSTGTRADKVESPVSVGTAWPIASGYAVTNHHVVEGKKHVTLVSRDGSEITARVIASDKTHDIAFLRVDNPNNLPPALPFSKQRASLGASVFTIGFPLVDIMGKTPKLSQGIISGVNGVRDDPTSYQISVPIQPGNSGGPLLNMRGEVVGMITSMLGSVMGEQDAHPLPNISYALKVNIIKQVLNVIPDSSLRIDELPAADTGLESLATRIQDSVLLVMAE